MAVRQNKPIDNQEKESTEELPVVVNGPLDFEKQLAGRGGRGERGLPKDEESLQAFELTTRLA
jgi:hypothetical protein